MRLLSINKFYWLKGGSEAVFFGEKSLLESHGHIVIPFSMRSEKNEPCEYSDYFVNEIDYDKDGVFGKAKAAMGIIYSLDARRKMRALLAAVSPDVAHFHIFQHQISPSVFGPLRESGIPKILTLHDLKPLCPNYKMFTNNVVCEACRGRRFYNCFKRRCTKGSALKSMVNVFEMYLHYMLGYYQEVDRYIAVSRFYRNKMIEYGFAEDQVDYLPNYVDLSIFRPSIDDNGYGVYFGRLSEEKGLGVLLDAAILNKEIPIYIVGAGPSESVTRERIERENIENIHMLGYKTGPELRNLISNASFSVIPSVSYENCPMSVLESLALGTPVIGSRIGGIPELIDEGVDGCTFEHGVAEDLSKKMCFLWEMSKRERVDMGMAGREKIGEVFHPERHYDGLMKIYSDVM